MKRRAFLYGAALCALRAVAAENGFPLGFSLYGMKTVPLHEALRACAKIGYTGVELSLLPGYETEPERFGAEKRAALREEIASLGLSTNGLMANLKLASDEKTLATLRTACAFARDVDPLIETVLGGKPSEWEAAREKMAEDLRAWASLASAAGVTLALKAHVNNAVDSPERLLWLLDAVKSPALAAAYDYSHFELAGRGLRETMELLLPRTRFIHLKDTAGTPEKFQFLLPGKGRTDYAEYFKLLREFGYKGPIVVEVSAQIFNQPGYDSIAAARESLAALRSKL